MIDEAHHLLDAPALYDLARGLSRSTKGLLLLSALPAQHREEEYLRLLALLEPGQYEPGCQAETERFRLLYGRQRQLGTVLRWISRRLPELSEGEREPADFVQKLAELSSWQVLERDEKLRALVRALDGASQAFTDDVKAILHHVGDSHRVNRRILRDRRARLIAQEEMTSTQRQLQRLTYQPDQFEYGAREHVRRLLSALRRDGLGEEALFPLGRLLFQACADPDCLVEALGLAASSPAAFCPADDEALALNSFGSYADWTSRARILWEHAALVPGWGSTPGIIGFTGRPSSE